jgi:hypothetical protein
MKVLFISANREYTYQLNRLKVSGVLQWEKDGLIFQKESVPCKS